MKYKIHAAYECLCDCGKTKVIAAMSLKNGNTKSCGWATHEEQRANRRPNGTGRKGKNHIIK